MIVRSMASATSPLTIAFAAGRGRPCSEADLAAVHAALVDGMENARRAYPAVDLPGTELAEHLGRLLADERDPVEGLKGLRVTDLYLCLACMRGHARAIATFDAKVLAQLDGAIAGAGASADRIDEVKQRLRERLLVDTPDHPAKINAYHGRGSLRNWVKVVAVREALVVLKKDGRRVDHDDEQLEASLDVDRDPELAFVKQQYRAEFRLSFAEALASLSSRDRTVLRLQHVDRLTLDQTAAVLHVHRATIARWNARIRDALLKRTRGALARRLRIELNELDSIMRLIQSNLEVSVRRLLKPETDA